jgi:hypothetical protein
MTQSEIDLFHNTITGNRGTRIYANDAHDGLSRWSTVIGDLLLGTGLKTSLGHYAQRHCAWLSRGFAVIESSYFCILDSESWLLNSFFLWCLVPIPILPAAGCLLPAFTYEIRWRILSGMSKLA